MGDTRELMRLLIRAETEPDFIALLRSQGDRLVKLFEPERERIALEELLEDIAT